MQQTTTDIHVIRKTWQEEVDKHNQNQTKDESAACIVYFHSLHDLFFPSSGKTWNNQASIEVWEWTSKKMKKQILRHGIQGVQGIVPTRPHINFPRGKNSTQIRAARSGKTRDFRVYALVFAVFAPDSIGFFRDFSRFWLTRDESPPICPTPSAGALR